MNDLMSRKIGILSKNYDFVKETLFRNIGSGQFDYDGIGTPIGQVANPNLNSYYVSWFYKDEKKKQYPTYLDYVKGTYFNGQYSPLNTESIEDKINNFSRNSLLFDNNQVGVIRGYDIFAENQVLNNNGWDDTKLGMINAFYLRNTLEHSQMVNSHRSSYINTTSEGDVNYEINGVTQGAYNDFGLNGQFGIGSEGFIDENGVKPNKLFRWNIFNPFFSGATLDFGQLDDMSYQLYMASAGKTQDFIAKSMMGVDLLRKDVTPSLFSGIVVSGKKYFATIGTRGRSYIGMMSDGLNGDSYSNIAYEFLDDNEKHMPIRIKFYNLGNNLTNGSRVHLTYAEKELGSSYDGQQKSYNEGTEYNVHGDFDYGGIVNTNDIIYKTNLQFKMGKYDTLISRFHTKGYTSTQEAQKMRSQIESANSKYGLSHGRNLLRKDHETTHKDHIHGEGYSNPYCRVWTYHHQYKSLKDTIRPFYNEDGSVQDLSETEIIDYRVQANQERLSRYGVKGKNGLLKITPTKEEDSSNGENIKRCMFSIENLAWKGDANKALKDNYIGEKGPRGGRIMWFPPYDLRFNESVGVNWSQNQFIGRGESIYTYTNTERSGTLSFKLLIDHPSIINNWRMEKNNAEQGVDDVLSTEQKLLRFFAGCEPLEKSRPKKPKESNPTTEVVTNEEPQVESTVTPVVSSRDIYFYVFFPNNYSGIDDQRGLIKPMEYLINGVGCNLTDENKDDNQPFAVRWDPRDPGYEMNGTNGISKTNKLVEGASGNKDALIKGQLGTYICVNKAGNLNYWGYRVDKSTEKEILASDNYFDTSNYSLNGSGYKQLLQAHTDAEAFNDDIYSFSSIFCALDSRGENVCSDDPDMINQLREMIGGFSSEWEVTNVEIAGFASSHGTSISNNQLNQNRAKVIKNWLRESSESFQNEKIFKEIVTDIGELKKTTTNVSDFEAKVWRCSRVKISLVRTEQIIHAPTMANVLPESSSNTIWQTYQVQNMEKLQSIHNLNSKDTSYDDSMKLRVKELEEAEKIAHLSDRAYSDGYGREYEFFEELKRNNPFLHSKIVDKIKFFDPAYHSITPEGFNSRLTFLHQCTRQGNTYNDTNGSVQSAGNLSFGAPPICVLRIGDFYNTKIIIESLQIDYDDTTWDLNDEGIGVMPMMANINIGFKFIGGSDLSGPIARLQNAVSFNYYANTNVYDSRADVIEYNEDGSIKDLKVNN